MAKDVEFVQVFATDDLGRYLFAKSLLDSEQIEYVTKGETLKNAVGWSASGTLDTVRGPAELWVRADDADRTRSLLLALDELGSEPGDESNGDV